MRSNYNQEWRATNCRSGIAYLLISAMLPAFALVLVTQPGAWAGKNGPFKNMIAQADQAPPEPGRRFRKREKLRAQGGAGGDNPGGPYGERPFRHPMRGGDADTGGGEALPGGIRPFTANPGDAAMRGQNGEPGPGAPDMAGEGRFRRRFGGNQAPGERFGGAPGGGRFAGRRMPAEQGAFPRGGKLGGSALFGKRPLDLSNLNLTDDQKQRIQQIRGANGTRSRKLQKDVWSARAEMRELMFDPSASEEQIRAKRRELRQMQDKMEDIQIGDFLSIRKVLTPEQRQRLSDLKPTGKMAESAGAPGGEGLAPNPAGSFAGEPPARRNIGNLGRSD